MKSQILNQVFVSLDLETTGLNLDNDEIIEIGAIKFQNEKVLGTFKSFVKPPRMIPAFVSLMTGITNDDVNDAPELDEISADLTAFVGDSAIVGQNISFDLSFLQKRGILFRGPAYDTLEMSLILCPRFPEHNLSALARELGINVSSAHRALDDADTTMQVFNRLLNRVESLQEETVHAMAPLVQDQLWPFGMLLRSRIDSHLATDSDQFSKHFVQIISERMDESFATHPRIVPNSTREPVSLDDLGAIFDGDSKFASARQNYEMRPQQKKMAVSVGESINDSTKLVIEAGAGTGKSLAYLVPALSYALKNDETVVVSTSTRGLQEQLMTKDVPDALLALGKTEADAHVITIKGQGNYLCLQRLIERIQAMVQSYSSEEAKFLIRLIVWLEESITGDQGELTLWAHERKLWDAVSAWDSEKGEDCLFRRQGRCFVDVARRHTRSAHLVLTNHAFLLADAARNSGFLAHSSHLIVDEAHKLEDEATNQFGGTLDHNDLSELFSPFLPQTQKRDSFGDRIQHNIKGNENLSLRLMDVQKSITSIIALAERGNNNLDVLFDGLAKSLKLQAKESNNYQQRLRITSATHNRDEWHGIVSTVEDLAIQFSGLHTELERLERIMVGDGMADVNAEIVSLRQQIVTKQEILVRVLIHTTVEDIRWISQNPRGGLSLNYAPLDVGPTLNEKVFSQNKSTVFTSATISLGRTFDYFKGRLGLDDAQSILLDESFDYRDAAAVFIPRDMPDMDTSEYDNSLGNAVIDLVEASQGHALMLFTSHAALRRVHKVVAPSLQELGFDVLAQGIDGRPGQLVAIFRESEKTLLLGTGTFWEGVDFAGDALQLLMMARLPFRVPNDPIFAARSEIYEDPFNEMAIPESILRFRQGFGRLIRTNKDHGAVVLFDNRLINRPYGQLFLDALPETNIQMPTLDDLPDFVGGWIHDSTG